MTRVATRLLHITIVWVEPINVCFFRCSMCNLNELAASALPSFLIQKKNYVPTKDKNHILPYTLLKNSILIIMGISLKMVDLSCVLHVDM